MERVRNLNLSAHRRAPEANLAEAQNRTAPDQSVKRKRII
jgi:hypothetical protein